LETARLPIEAMLNRPDRESRLKRRISAVCLRSCLSSVRLMASRLAFVISRSWTLRSRRALTTRSVRSFSCEGDFVGEFCESGVASSSSSAKSSAA
jgi:hypothetical protein